MAFSRLLKLIRESHTDRPHVGPPCLPISLVRRSEEVLACLGMEMKSWAIFSTQEQEEQERYHVGGPRKFDRIDESSAMEQKDLASSSKRHGETILKYIRIQCLPKKRWMDELNLLRRPLESSTRMEK